MKKGFVMVIGVLSGAVLMALSVIMIFVLGTGFGGGIVTVCVMAVAGATGYLMGVMHGNPEDKRRRYM